MSKVGVRLLIEVRPVIGILGYSFLVMKVNSHRYLQVKAVQRCVS